MKNLYIETKNGAVPIDKNIEKKYKLEKGTMTPFTDERILGAGGDFTKEKHDDEAMKNLGNVRKEDGVEPEDGIMLTTSEIIDFTQGTDSYTDNDEMKPF